MPEARSSVCRIVDWLTSLGPVLAQEDGISSLYKLLSLKEGGDEYRRQYQTMNTNNFFASCIKSRLYDAVTLGIKIV